MLIEEAVYTKNKSRLNEIWTSCPRQLCTCSKKDNPHFKHEGKCRCGCRKFTPMDFGCWSFAVGKKPKRMCIDECVCECHGRLDKLLE